MKKILGILIAILFCSTFNIAFAKVDANNYKYGYVNIPFWQNFNDYNLLANLNTVYKNNNDLKATSLKVSEAQKLVKISLADELPHIGFNGNIKQTFRSSDEVFGDITIPDFTETQFLLPLTLSYEIDIWGKNHLKTKAYKKKFEAMQQDEKTVYISITSAFASDYYNLIKVDKLIELQKELISTQKEVVRAIEKKYNVGTANINQVITEKKSLTYLEEELNNLLEKQDVLKNQMSVILADRSFQDISRTDYNDIKAKVAIPKEISTSVLISRPDNVKSELNLEKIGIDVKVARRELLPKFNLVGNLGFNAYNLSTSNTFLANLAIAPTWDLFMGGKKIQLLKLQKDEYKIALEHYDKTLLKSIQETNDALYTLKSINGKYSIAKDRYALSKVETKLTQKKEQLGIADKLNTLYQKEIELVTEQQVVSLKINELIAMINLYQALGGINFFNAENL